MFQTDALVIGAGTAGCTFALNLARFAHVTVAERLLAPEPRVGESLPPAANKLLQDMGIYDDFVMQGHLQGHGNSSRWGSSLLQYSDFLRDPAGPGWHLNRQGFETWLQQKAIERGAKLLTGTKLLEVERLKTDLWQVSLLHNSKKVEVLTPLIVDASGRHATLARKMGAQRNSTDKLICGWLIGEDNNDYLPGVSYIQSDKYGWWYTSPIPGGRRIISFHSDADVPGAGFIKSTKSFMKHLSRQEHLTEHFNPVSFYSRPQHLLHGTTAAHSSFTQPAAGVGWLALGDAAMSFDPLSSQGLFNAMYTALAGAESAWRFLQGEIQNFDEYTGVLKDVVMAYRGHLEFWYSMETRWREELFWKRRLRTGT